MIARAALVLCCIFSQLPPAALAGGKNALPEYGLIKTPVLPYAGNNGSAGGMQIPKNMHVTAPVVEDPDWYYPHPGTRERPPSYTGRWNRESYTAILKEALNGNPVAMAELIILAQDAQARLAAAYPDFPPDMHNMCYWLDWATRYTSPGWIYTRLALYDQGIGCTRSAYAKGAFLGDPKSMYAYATRWNTGVNLHWLLLSADAGWGPAAREISRWYRYGGTKGGFRIEQNTDKGKTYQHMAMRNGVAMAFSDAAHDALTGFQDTPVNVEKAYVYAYISYILNKTENGFLLMERTIPPIPLLDFSGVLGCAFYDVFPPRPLRPEEEAAKQARKRQATARSPLSTEANARARQEAVHWLMLYKAAREAQLQSERQRRNVLSRQLRKECAPAVEYLKKMTPPPGAKSGCVLWTHPALSAPPRAISRYGVLKRWQRQGDQK